MIVRILLFLFCLTAPVLAQTPSVGEKPLGFDGVQEPTDRPAALNTPLEVRYPDSAMKARLQGVVAVAAWIDARGYVTYAEVQRSSGHVLLDEEALRAVADGDFKPAKRDGRMSGSRISVPVEFRLARNEDEYDAVKSSEQLQQEAEELRRVRQMLEEDQRQLEEEILRLKEEQRRREAEKQKSS
ncbi:MAG: TonB family protein [Bacteroidetes bacterium]|nr:TonB family protein [Bacteroidota bacterium]